MGFVGREGEFATLHAEADAARAGEVRFVVLTGDAGIGKSALAQHLGQRLTVDGFRMCRTGFGSIAGTPPLLPWERVLTTFRTDGGPSDPASASGRDSAPSDPAMANGSSHRASATAGFERIATIADRICALAHDRPLLIVLDDLQHATSSSLAPLTYLLELAAQVPVLILGLVREPPGLAAELIRPSAWLALRGLTSIAAGELAAQVLGRPVPARVAAELCRRCDGNPSLMVDVLRGWDPEQPDAGVDRLAFSWPQQIRAAAVEQLRPLQPETLDVLNIASVIGREFDLGILERLVPSATKLITAIDDARACGVLEAKPNQVYAFTRAIVREVIYDSLGESRRASIHEAVAGALAEFRWQVGDRGPTTAELAHHLVAAAVLGGSDRLDLAIAYASAAGTAAERDGLHHDACAYLEAAVGLAVRAQWSTAPLARLTIALGRARLAAGDIAAGRAALASVIRQARTSGDSELLALAVLGYGPRAAIGLRPPDGYLIDLLTEATVSPLQARTAACVSARLAVELAGSAQHGEVDALLRPVDESDPAAAEVLTATARVRRTPDAGRAAVRAAARRRDPLLRAEAQLALGAAVLAAGDLAGAGLELDAAIRMCAAAHHPVADWWAASVSGTLAALSGGWAQAEASVVNARTAGDRLADDLGDLGYAAQLGALRVAQGRAVELAPLLAELSRAANPAGWLSALSARIAVERGQTAIAMAILSEAVVEPDPWTAALLADVAIDLADQAAMTALDERLATAAGGFIVFGPALVCAGPAALVRARLRLALNDPTGARELLDRVAPTVAGTPWRAEADLSIAALLATTDPKAAVAAAESAVTAARQAGLAPVAEQAGQLIAELIGGDRTMVGLTRREQEVLDLALAGTTARDIATLLFISERTAESHLASIYRKLNVRSRVELMARGRAG